jgi:hypothetical protein
LDFSPSRIFQPCVEANSSVNIYNPQATSGEISSSRGVESSSQEDLHQGKEISMSFGQFFRTRAKTGEGQKRQSSRKEHGKGRPLVL